MGMIDNLEKMLESGRDDAMLRFGLGSAYFNDNQFEAAIPHLEACLKHDENYTAAYKLLGKAWFQLGDSDRATKVFEKGIPLAIENGDKQSQKEMEVFLSKAKRQGDQE